MSIHTTTPENGIAHGVGLSKYKWLGVDREEFHHVLDRERDVVHRISVLEPERERVTALHSEEFAARGNAIEAYVHEHVAVAVGWRNRAPTTRDLFGGAR